jgi:hypothetical protein
VRAAEDAGGSAVGFLESSNQKGEIMGGTLTRLAAVLTTCAILGACGGSSPTTPSTLNIAGVWAGDIVTILGNQRTTWTLSQSGTNVTGPVVVANAGIPVISGALTGTISGSTLTYSINIPAGGILISPTCTGHIDGTMNLPNERQMSGKFTGTSTCNAPISGGDLTLSKQ